VGRSFRLFGPRPMNSLQRAAQRFDFPFVGEFLALGQFDQFKHFLHLIERLFERFDYLRYFFNCLADGRSGSFGFLCGQSRRFGRRTGPGNLFHAARTAAAAAAMAAPSAAVRTSRRRGSIRFGLWFLHHFWVEHDALPDKSNPESVRGYFFTNSASEAV